MTNIYGPGMSQNNVMSDILMQLNSNRIKLKNLYANRDFLWVDDALTQSYLLVKNIIIF